MSNARHHLEWLNLVDISGPFLSLNVLMEVFPNGLDPHQPELVKQLRQAYSEWQASQEQRVPDVTIQHLWLEYVFDKVLGFDKSLFLRDQAIADRVKVELPQHRETLKPDYLLVNPKHQDSNKIRLVVQTYPSTQHLGKSIQGRSWSATPADRMRELLKAYNLQLGLVTNGKQWMLISTANEEATGYISWYANFWLEEPITLRAFRSLLAQERFFAVAENNTLEAMLSRSADAQQEVTNRLGYQVREAVQIIIQTIDRIDKDRHRELLFNISEKELYEAALTVMMRLVFLFYAEERELIVMSGESIYEDNYAVSTLREQLRKVADEHGEELLERRYDAWMRLLATFRAVYDGVRHQDFQLPAYGGRLFDPDRFPFLEGRTSQTSWKQTRANPIPIDNRTVLHLLEALQILKVKIPGGGSEPRRLSFRALDVEQIGHVYEGLLDHTAVRARVTVIGLSGTKDNHPEVVLEELLQRSGDELVAYLKALTGRSESAIRNGLNVVLDQQEEAKFKRRCEFDESLWQQIKPFAALIRKDYLEHPVIITPHSIYVTQGEDRRSTGTHYTPRSLTEPIVEYTLEPAVYVGIAEGLPKQDWKLKSAKELLELKICDVAMGSGAFLVQACRYLATKLVEAWNNIKAANPNKVIVAPEGELSEGAISEEIIPQDPTEKLLEAMRIVADRCLYGVDKNPMAVEMGKLSLWLVTLQKRKPFTFLDHALRCGDSLLGVTKSQQIEFFHLQPETKMVKPFGGDFLKESLENIVNKRTQIEHIRTESRQDLDYKEKLLKEIEQDVEQASLIADLLVGEFLKESGQIKPESFAAKELSAVLAEINNKLLKEGSVSELQDKAKKLLGSNKPFHWLLEFPEVFWKDDAGFDAIISNPPFLGGQKLTGTLGVNYRDFLVEQIGKGKRGSADLCAYFFLRASSLLNKSGGFGMLATNTIAQGDTREVGLDQLVAEGAFIQRAIPSRKWPGVANLEVAQVWIRNGVWKSECYLDEKPVNQISAFLTVPSRVAGNPYRLAANQSKSFIGSYVLGMGFVMTPEEAQALIAKDPKNRDVLFPYLNGEDLNSRPDQSPSRWVINFRDWPLDRESAPKDYKGSVAADYPDCLKIIEEKVKPERAKLALGNAIARDRAKRWWQFAGPTKTLYSTIEAMERVLVFAQTSKTKYPTFVNTGIVFDQKTVVIVVSTCKNFSLLCSHIHQAWVLEKGSSLKLDAVYTPSDCFETFPFPENIDSLEAIGESYYKHRQEVMAANGEGLTKTYNRFHNPEDKSAEIERLRQLHVEMDCKVAAAYGWQDLKLGHGFHQTKQGLRFTISEDARREVLDRLLELNHQRYTKELDEGLYGKSKKKPANRKTKKTEVEKIAQESLF